MNESDSMHVYDFSVILISFLILYFTPQEDK